MDGPDNRDKGDGLPERLEEDSGQMKQKKNKSWDKRSSLEKKLIIIIGLAAVFILILIIIVIAVASLPRQDETCYTEGCVKAASRIIKGMNKDASPCDDFFEYACGQWNRNHRIPDGETRTTSFGVLRKEVKQVLRGSLEEPVKSTDPRAVAKAKDLYKECVNRTQTETRGTAPLFSYLSQFGGWPVLDRNWREQDFDLVDLMVKLREQGSSTFFWSYVNVDEKKSDKYINTFGESPGLGMSSRDYYFKGRDDPTLQSYEKFAYTLATLLGADPTYARDEMRKMVDFEIEIAKISTPQEDERDLEAMYNKMTLKKFQEQIPEFDWARYTRESFAFVNITSNLTDQVMVKKPEYLKAIFKLIAKTEKQTVANYILWRLVKRNINDLPERFRKPRNEFSKVIYGTGDEKPRWESCVYYCSKLGGVIGRIFIEKKFDVNSKVMAEEMITNIRAAFGEFLDETDWMDDVTKMAAKEKAAGLRPKVAYPDFIMNNTALDEKYNYVKVLPGKFLETVIENQKIKAKRNLKKIRETIDRSHWSVVYPATVNAYYFPSSNQIMFPAAILQPPYFHQDFPKYLNYGGMGMMMGHEITHGFDDEGRQTDKDGNLVSWWQPATVKKFKDKAQCIIDQYSNFYIKEINMTLNGINTQGENIADNGGLKEAFRAYRNFVAKRDGEEAKLPGIGLTGNQLFFVNFAQIRCSRERPEALLMSVRSWRHSPNRYRVIGTVSNMPEFASTFNCPVGSPMNPEKKCRVW